MSRKSRKKAAWRRISKKLNIRPAGFSQLAEQARADLAKQAEYFELYGAGYVAAREAFNDDQAANKKGGA